MGSVRPRFRLHLETHAHHDSVYVGSCLTPFDVVWCSLARALTYLSAYDSTIILLLFLLDTTVKKWHWVF